MINKIVMSPKALCPGETFPREWKLYLSAKRRKMDEMTLEEFLQHWDVNRHELARFWQIYQAIEERSRSKNSPC
jgi:hypothetical protein